MEEQLKRGIRLFKPAKEVPTKRYEIILQFNRHFNEIETLTKESATQQKELR